MYDIKWLFSLEYSMFKNRYWKDGATRSRTLIGLLAISAFIYLLTQILYNSFSFEVDNSSMYFNVIVFLLFFVVVIWISFMSFIQGLSNFSKVFYKSPEMNHLVTLPISYSKLFFYRLIKLIFMSNKSMLVLYIPFAATIGLHINAPLIFYVLIIPLYFVITIIPSSLAAIVALLGFKFLSNRVFSLLTTITALGLNVGFALIFTRSTTLFEKLYPQIVSLFEKEFVLDIIPLISGTRLFLIISEIDQHYPAMLFYITTTLILFFMSVLIAKRFYFKSFEKNQIVENGRIKNNQVFKKESMYSNFSLIIHWMKVEWKMASRNYDMFIASISMLSFYILAVLALTFGNLFSKNATIEIALLIFMSTMFNVMAISLLFLPSQINKDKSLWKNRYWLLKILPLSGNQILLLQSFMYFIPAYGISLTGLIIYAIFSSLSFPILLVSSLIMLVSLFGASLVFVTTEILSLSEFFEKNTMIGNLMSFLLPILYALLTSGLITLIIAKAYLVNISFIYQFASFLSLFVAILISIMTFILASLYARRVFSTVWHKLEIS